MQLAHRLALAVHELIQQMREGHVAEGLVEQSTRDAEGTIRVGVAWHPLVPELALVVITGVPVVESSLLPELARRLSAYSYLSVTVRSNLEMTAWLSSRGSVIYTTMVVG